MSFDYLERKTIINHHNQNGACFNGLNTRMVEVFQKDTITKVMLINQKTSSQELNYSKQF